MILYNEIFNEQKLVELESEVHISEQAKHFSELTKDDYIDAQYNLQNYIQTKDNQYLTKYNIALTSLNKNIQQLANTAGKSDLFSLYLNQDTNNKVKLSVDNITNKIDSLREIQILPSAKLNENGFKLKTFNYDDILDDVNVETTVSVDSVKRKGLFSRVSNAIAGKVDVQKEKSNVVVTFTKGSKVTSGTIEEQLEEIVKATNDYYQKEFANYRKNYEKQRAAIKNESTSFFETNKELLDYSNLLLKKYNDALVSFTNNARQKFNEQYKINKQIRNNSVIALIFFMVIISIVLIFITRLTFAYEATLLKAQKKIKQNLNFKDRIVGMISHEIRAPLNIISIYSKGIRRQVEDKEVQESIKSIEFTTHSLMLLANQILDYSKNEYNKIQLNKTTFNLKNELEGVLKSLKSFVENNGNSLVVSNNVGQDLEIYSDFVKIHQLFYNVVGNANKFTNNGTISININADKINDTEVALNVEIKDNGIGIEPNDLKHIFKNYHQGEISPKLQNLGVGLGLNLCKEIVELFKGKIDVSSKKNVETTVKFYLILDTPKKQ